MVDDTGYKRFIVLGKLEPEELTLDEAIDRALKNRAELEEMRAKIKAAEWGLFLAKIDRYPKITAEYSYDVNLEGGRKALIPPVRRRCVDDEQGSGILRL